MEQEIKKSYHHKDLRNSLIEKGIEMVSEDGVKELSLRKLASECGVSHGAPYSHFSNKEELLRAMQEYITKQFADCLQQTYKEYQKSEDVLLYMGQEYVNFFTKHPTYFSFIFSKSEIKIDLSSLDEEKDNYEPFEIYKKATLLRLQNSSYTKEMKKDILIAMWTFVHGIAAVATMKNVTYDENWSQKLIDFLKMFRL